MSNLKTGNLSEMKCTAVLVHVFSLTFRLNKAWCVVSRFKGIFWCTEMYKLPVFLCNIRANIQYKVSASFASGHHWLPNRPMSKRPFRFFSLKIPDRCVALSCWNLSFDGCLDRSLRTYLRLARV